MNRSLLFSSITAFLGDIGRARTAALTYKQLAALSDDALAARGISRGDLPSVAYKRAFER